MPVSYPTPLAHAEDILNTFFIDAKNKYLAGQIEHGGRLWRKPVLPMLYAEVLDLPIYLLTLMDQVGEARKLLSIAMAAQNWNGVEAAYNMLAYGNAEGATEEDR